LFRPLVNAGTNSVLLVVPIITYGCEVWGIYDLCKVDELHYKFCNFILSVCLQTSNAAVLGDLGRLPLSLICKQRTLKFFSSVKLYGEIIENHIVIRRYATSL